MSVLQKTAGAAAALGLALSGGAGAAAQAPGAGEVIELRQYKIVPGRRDAMIDLFERHLVESQEDVGMRLIGQFRDLDDPNRFTWLRAFDDMQARDAALNAFYFGPVWQAHRGAANPLLEDNDNVLLLRPAARGSGIAASVGVRPGPDAPAEPAGVIIATVHYLWKDPTEGFDAFFATTVMPELEAAGLPVLGAYVPETTPNSFLRLPVRQAEKVFVWFTRADSPEAFEAAWSALLARSSWVQGAGPQMADREERPAQVLRLRPTPRSLLR